MISGAMHGHAPAPNASFPVLVCPFYKPPSRRPESDLSRLVTSAIEVSSWWESLRRRTTRETAWSRRHASLELEVRWQTAGRRKWQTAGWWEGKSVGRHWRATAWEWWHRHTTTSRSYTIRSVLVRATWGLSFTYVGSCRSEEAYHLPYRKVVEACRLGSQRAEVGMAGRRDSGRALGSMQTVPLRHRRR